tara:strand:+ start:1136 stop:1444 length:309 start_codon:yes stop_codon:yes gene_type:complete
MYGDKPAKKNPHAHKANKEGKPLYKPMKSTRKGKKGMVYVMKDGKKRLIHFGDSSMTDKRKGASKAQQKSYLARSAGIRNKEGKLTKNDKNSANYWSRRVNW